MSVNKDSLGRELPFHLGMPHTSLREKIRMCVCSIRVDSALESILSSRRRMIILLRSIAGKELGDRKKQTNKEGCLSQGSPHKLISVKFSQSLTGFVLRCSKAPSI